MQITITRTCAHEERSRDNSVCNDVGNVLHMDGIRVQMTAHFIDFRSKQSTTWADVYPGDIVQSKGTLAYNLNDANDKGSILAHAPFLILARLEGERPPQNLARFWDADDRWSRWRTFVLLTRHGLMVTFKDC